MDSPTAYSGIHPLNSSNVPLSHQMQTHLLHTGTCQYSYDQVPVRTRSVYPSVPSKLWRFLPLTWSERPVPGGRSSRSMARNGYRRHSHRHIQSNAYSSCSENLSLSCQRTQPYPQNGSWLGRKICTVQPAGVARPQSVTPCPVVPMAASPCRATVRVFEYEYVLRIRSNRYPFGLFLQTFSTARLLERSRGACSDSGKLRVTGSASETWAFPISASHPGPLAPGVRGLLPCGPGAVRRAQRRNRHGGACRPCCFASLCKLPR